MAGRTSDAENPRDRQAILRRAAVTVLIVLAGCAGGARHVSPTTSVPTETALPSPTSSTAARRAACSNSSAVAAWPLSRRAAQLVVIPALDGNVASLGATVADGVGGVLLLGQATPADLRQQVDVANRVAGQPLLVMADQEGGDIQRLGSRVTPSLPWARQMAGTMSPSQVQQAALHVALQMRALGVNVDLAPVLDLDGGNGPNIANPDGLRSFSVDPVKASQYGLAFIGGLRAGGVVPVVKHFPGLGGSTPNTDYGPANTQPLSSLRSAGLLPFQAAIAAGVPAVMVANATVPGLTTGPASLSRETIADLLRRELGFGGLVLTDSLSAGAITAAGYEVPAAAVAAIRAGADMVLFGSTLTAAETRLLSPVNVAGSTSAIIDALVHSSSSGALTTARLDEAVGHVLSAKGVNLCA